MTPTEWIYEAARLEAIASKRRIVPEQWEKRDSAFKEQMTDLALVEFAFKYIPTP
jgi:hypothetical protein